jgi:hypothetical protein
LFTGDKIEKRRINVEKMLKMSVGFKVLARNSF